MSLFWWNGLLALLFAATAAQAANLGEVYRQAQANDPLYAAAREAYRAGREKAKQGLAGLRPNANLSANLRHNETDSSLGGSRSYNSYGMSLTLTQPLYRKQNLEGYEQGKLQTLLAQQQLQVAEQDLLLRTARAYFDLLQAQDDLTTAQAQKAAIAEQLAQAKKSFEVGAATIVDTHEAQARHDLALAQEIAAENDLEVRRRALEKILDNPPPKLARLDEKATIALPHPRDLDMWVHHAAQGGLGVLIGETAREIASREVKRQRGGHQPTLDLAASYSDNRNSSFGATTGIDTQSAVLGLEFNLPLYQGGGTESRVREAAANLEKARYDLNNASRQAVLDTRQAYLGVMSGEAKIRALQQALVSSEAQLKSTKLGVEVGVRTRVDVLNTQQQLYGTKRDLAAARYQTLLAGLQLKAAAGRLTENDFETIDALLKE